MKIVEFYQATLVAVDGQLTAGLVAVPAAVFEDQTTLGDADKICDALDLTPRFESDSPSSLVYMIASVLATDSAEAAEQQMLELVRLASHSIWEKIGADIAQFAEYVTYSDVIPFQRSPLQLTSLAAIASAGSKASAVGIGFAVGLAAGYGSAFVLVTVPAGIILCGAAIAVAKALQEGLTPRLTALIQGKPMKRSRPKIPKEKIVASVKRPPSSKSSKQ